MKIKNNHVICPSRKKRILTAEIYGRGFRKKRIFINEFYGKINLEQIK